MTNTFKQLPRCARPVFKKSLRRMNAGDLIEMAIFKKKICSHGSELVVTKNEWYIGISPLFARSFLYNGWEKSMKPLNFQQERLSASKCRCWKWENGFVGVQIVGRLYKVFRTMSGDDLAEDGNFQNGWIRLHGSIFCCGKWLIYNNVFCPARGFF